MSDSSRRDFVKKAVYVTPVVLTLAAAPEFAKAGSVKGGPPQERMTTPKPPKDHPRTWASPSPVTDARWLG